MADTFKVKVRYKVYQYATLALLYPASYAHKVSLFFQGLAEEIRPAATDAFFATEKGAAFKVKLETAAKEFFDKLQAKIDAAKATEALPEVKPDGGTTS